ncbi:universal stress protein UspA [Iodidimonas gelatinilytica]|uniref:Universal stress protein UspA n=1 Tax=Iodidimonas gelatinilytica TaxID=1236966 RepID=A0A5A7N2A4_9PROT|nr:universal stress protein [Iodidimonas gelatinilytica]GER02238.1 universal stress protein UspA [Iodidimonas gelatinilytica]
MTNQTPHIIACTDGSGYATSVYDHAAWASRRIEAGVEALHVLDQKRPASGSVDFSGAMRVDEREDLLTHLADLDAAQAKVAQIQGRAILDHAVQYLRDKGVADVQSTLRHGTLVEALHDLEAHTRLIVIGKRGHSADFDHLHLGGKLERVIRASARPVLVASRAFKPIKRALIAYDGSPSAEKAISHAIEKPLLKGLSVHLLMVGANTDAHRSSLHAAQEKLKAAEVNVTASLEPGDAETVISRTVAQDGIDLLVVGAYGHSRVRQLIVGSTTTALIRTCLVPLLMFR